MVAVLTRDEVEFESAFDLLKNNAANGGSRQEMRAIEDELEAAEQLAQAESFVGQQVAFGNISAVQKASQKAHILNPITGEVYEVEDGYEDELSVASILSLIDRGASDDEISAAIGAALEGIALDAADEKKTRRRLAKLLEVLHVLEVAAKQQGKDPELQASLRQLQEGLSKILASKNFAQLRDFLKNPLLQTALRDATLQSRQLPDFLRSVRDLTRSLATRSVESNVGRDSALASLQASLRDVLQAQLRASYAQLQQAFEAMRRSAMENPAARDAANQAMRDLAAQAQRVRQLAEQAGRGDMTMQAAEQARAALQQMQLQTMGLMQDARLSSQQQQILGSLSASQRSVLQAVDARMAAQRVGEGNLSIAKEAGRQEVRGNLDSQLNLVQRAGTDLVKATNVMDKLAVTNKASLENTIGKDRLGVELKSELATREKPSGQASSVCSGCPCGSCHTGVQAVTKAREGLSVQVQAEMSSIADRIMQDSNITIETATAEQLETILAAQIKNPTPLKAEHPSEKPFVNEAAKANAVDMGMDSI